jgi:hypothetical protein
VRARGRWHSETAGFLGARTIFVFVVDHLAALSRFRNPRRRTQRPERKNGSSERAAGVGSKASRGTAGKSGCPSGQKNAGQKETGGDDKKRLTDTTP